MRIDRAAAALLGLVTLIPYAWLILSTVYLLPRLMSLGQPGGITPDDYFVLFNRVYTASLGVLGLTLALAAVYVVHVFHSGAVPTAERRRWTVLLLALGFILLPVYWYRFVWQRGSAQAA